MKPPYFDVELGCNVVTFDNIVKASEALAQQLHEESVRDGESLSTDMAERGYREYLINEARATLEQDGRSAMPTMEHHSLIVLETAQETIE